ncbi:MAG: BamA/TamA family outer membrane protein [Bacteroidales bacterium]|nr:BamA/TamA family outer membrane protein [Candidatus Cryptobacteroides choladohippi]
MKKLIVISILTLAAFSANAQKKDITKTGLNFGPLPAVAYDADKGFQAGAILQIFDYGDGHNYPNYDSKLYLEASFFTKGSQLYQVRYDNKELIPGVRWSSAFRANLDKAYDFYGFNGYESYYDYDLVAKGKDKKSEFQMFTPFYRMARNEFLFKSDFLGQINKYWQWEAGIFANYYKIGTINRDSINKGKSDTKKYTYPTTLYDEYRALGILDEKEADGGFASGLRAGMVYDSRDKEGAPTRGIWAEGHITAALPGISETPFYRYSLTWRHYLPIVKDDILTFAYRLNYEGTFGSSVPFYALPYMTVMGEKPDLEGMGGFFTCRGIMRTRVVGLDMATYNAELRWRFAKFHIGKQNIALGLSAFSDGTMVTRGRDISKIRDIVGRIGIKETNPDITKDRLHSTVGAGFRFIMNENFIVAAEYGTPVSHFMKKSPIYNQDGTGAFYINLGYLF